MALGHAWGMVDDAHLATMQASEARVLAENIVPEPRSGRQELLENIVNGYL